MNETPPDAKSVSQAFEAYVRARGVELTVVQSAIFHEAVKDILGEAQPDAYLTTELDGDVWTLIVVGDDLRLLRLKEDVVDIRFLGRLRGSYCEKLTVVPLGQGRHGFTVDLRFDVADKRFPGEQIELELPPTPPGGFRSDLAEQREEMIRSHLRPWLRACADKTTVRELGG
jgi:hypothetical protein